MFLEALLVTYHPPWFLKLLRSLLVRIYEDCPIIFIGSNFQVLKCRYVSASEVSLDVRIYPEDGKQLENNPQYGWTINVKKNSEPSLNFIDLHVSLTTPSKHNYLNGELINI